MNHADANYITWCAEKIAKERDSEFQVNFWLESLKEHLSYLTNLEGLQNQNNEIEEKDQW